MLTLSYSIGEGRYTYCETIPKGLVSFHPVSPPGFSSHAILWPWNVVCEFRIDIYTCRMFKNWSSRCKHNHPLSLIRIIDIYYCIDTMQVRSNWKKINILKKIQLKKSDRGKFWYALYIIFKSKQIRVSVKFVNIRNWLDSSITLKPLNFLFMKSMRTTDWTLINLIWSIIHYPTIVLQLTQILIRSSINFLTNGGGRNY